MLSFYVTCLSGLLHLEYAKLDETQVDMIYCLAIYTLESIGVHVCASHSVELDRSISTPLLLPVITLLSNNKVQ